MIKGLPIQKTEWDKLEAFLSRHDREDAIEGLAALTQKQALGLINYISEKQWLSLPDSATVLHIVLTDIAGFNSGNEMYVPKTSKFQPAA